MTKDEIDKLLEGVEMPEAHQLFTERCGHFVVTADQLRETVAAAVLRKDAEIANLHTVMMAAAVEITEHWDAHCDEEGYGPANLVRRLENGYPAQYGYDAKTLVRIEVERDALKAENERLTRQAFSIAVERDELRMELGDLPEAQAEMLTAIKQLKAENERGLLDAMNATRAFIKHSVEQSDDWSDWVCPDPKSYMMKCCDCGLVHEAQFKVVRYKSETEREDCDVVEDPNLQAVFRMRRSEQWTPEDMAHRPGGLTEADALKAENERLRAESKPNCRECTKWVKEQADNREWIEGVQRGKEICEQLAKAAMKGQP